MHVIVATDGSQASLAGARQFKWIADSREITDVTVVAVVSPYAAAPFANELGSAAQPGAGRAQFRRRGRRRRCCGRGGLRWMGAAHPHRDPQRLTRLRRSSGGRRPRRRPHLDGRGQPWPQPDDPARQHRLPGAALGAVLGADLPPDPEERARASLTVASRTLDASALLWLVSQVSNQASGSRRDRRRQGALPADRRERRGLDHRRQPGRRGPGAVDERARRLLPDQPRHRRQGSRTCSSTRACSTSGAGSACSSRPAPASCCSPSAAPRSPTASSIRCSPRPASSASAPTTSAA